LNKNVCSGILKPVGWVVVADESFIVDDKDFYEMIKKHTLEQLRASGH